MRLTSRLMVVLVLAASSCAPVSFTPPETDLLPSYEFQGLKIDVGGYTDPARSRQTFGTDLLSKGLLAVLVVIENDTKEAFLVEQRNFHLYPAFQRETTKSEETTALPATGAVGREAGGLATDVVRTSATVVGAAGVAHLTVTLLQASGATQAGATQAAASIASAGIPLNAIAAVALIPLAIGSEFASRDTEIAHHMTAVAIADRTLHQRQSMHGFLYFPCDSFDETATSQEFRLHIALRSMRDKTVWDVDVPVGRLFPEEAR